MELELLVGVGTIEHVSQLLAAHRRGAFAHIALVASRGLTSADAADLVYLAETYRSERVSHFLCAVFVV